MITEAIFRAFWGFLGLIDALIPPIPWPSWMHAPGDWIEDIFGSNQFAGAFVFIHPFVFDAAALTFLMVIILQIVRRLREAVSIATGGGTRPQ